MNHSGTGGPCVWPAPVLLALSTAAGLLSGLVGDGAWDVFGWFALGLPLAVALRCLSRRGAGRAAIPFRTPARRL